VGGASQISELEKMLREAGFDEIKIAPKDTSRSFIRDGCLEKASKTISFPLRSRR
jgi:hypothetical protein